MRKLHEIWKGWRNHVQAWMRSKQAFTWWVGYGAPPFLFGNVLVGFSVHWSFGLLNAVLVASFIWYTINTTCRRCPFYGTSHCPVPGKILPYFLPKLPDSSLPIKKIRQHYYVDLAMIAWSNFTYCFCPVLLPIVFLGSVGALYIVYFPKRHHGLLYRMNPLDGKNR